MLQLTQIRIECGAGQEALFRKTAKILHLKPSEPLRCTIRRHSVDCRKKPQLFDVYTVTVQLPPEQEAALLRKKIPGLTAYAEKPYVFPAAGTQRAAHRPVIIGFGPAGIFCGWFLAKHGYCPLILERGRAIPQRTEDVENFWKTGCLDTVSNIQFGEGGAGTFSDGKLNTLVKDKEGRNDEVLRIFAEAGAPGEILTEAKPHIGTDVLRSVIVRLREEIIRMGGEVRFESQVTALHTENGSIRGVIVNGTEEIPAETVVLAPGHSARDTFLELNREGVPMEEKDFAVGFRVAHPQSLIDHQQYGFSDRTEMKRKGLTPASYKLTARAASGRGVYSFCMCPGGYVVNASSEEGRLAVNGMSYFARASAQADSAIVMTVSAADFAAAERTPTGGNPEGQTVPEEQHPADVLAGMRFQQQLEEKCFRLGHGLVPVENYADFASAASLHDLPQELPALCILGGYRRAELHRLLPENLTRDFIDGMQQFDRTIRGFAGDQCWVIGLESRTSSPVRILRGEDFESAVRGLYPCGEGAGYAGGIMSAAMDGIRVAEAIRRKYHEEENH
jgi:uncharacterized FAD-dependent dehydrogenase